MDPETKGLSSVQSKKEPGLLLTLCVRVTYLSGQSPPSIVGVHELNFCVRDGERWERRQWRKQRPERVAAVGR